MIEIENETEMLVEALPPRTRLLHIGLPKSGTTYLQRAASGNRDALLEHGVRYPGSAINHRLPVLALMEKRMGWRGSRQAPQQDKWGQLMAEVEADKSRRIYISNESATLCTDAQAARFVESLGPRTHVLITLRGYASLLGSNWQQHIKTGAKLSFERWLHAVLAEPPTTDVGRAYDKRVNLTEVVTRWVSVAGAERVTVLIADKRRPTMLTDALADLLELPHHVLEADPAAGLAANRSMSYPEVEMIRAFNKIIRTRDRTDWAQYSMLIRTGGVARMLQMRTPGPDEAAVVLPAWAAAIAEPRARAHAEAVAACGARIIGSVESLYEPVATVAELPRVTSVPISAAAEAIAGVVSAATGRRAFFGADPAEAGALEESAAPAVGRMRPSGEGAKIWVGPAAADQIQAGKGGSRSRRTGLLARVAGADSPTHLQEVYLATETTPVRSLLAAALLRVARRARGTDRARSRR